VFDKYSMRIGAIFTIAPTVIIAEIDKFDDIGVVSAGTLHQASRSHDHFLFALVLNIVLIDELVRNHIAVALARHFGPVFDQQIGPALAAVAHYLSE